MLQSESRALTLVDNGKSDYVIVVSEVASPTEKTGAQDLANLLEDMTQVKLPVVTGDIPAGQKAIVIGDGRALKALKVKIDFTKLGDEGFAIKTVGDNLVIAGARLRGTLYGVYAFLEDVLGCRFYTRFVRHVPQMPTVTIGRLNIRQTPDFEYRDLWFKAVQDTRWAARNMVNGHHAMLDAEHGGNIRYGSFVHSMSWLLPEAEFYQDHPDYYALANGKRLGGVGGQPCLTHPDVLKIIVARQLKRIADDPAATIFSVSQNDNVNFCQCPNCARVDAEEGSHMGTMLRFVNAVADEVAKQSPQVWIDTLAYEYTENPPKITKPRPNVMIRLCTACKCQYHEYTKCERDAEFVQNLRAWHRLTPNLYIWHYASNFSGGHIAPWPDLGQIPSTLRLFKHEGVKGVFVQGMRDAGGEAAGEGAWMMDLKAYLSAKLMWNVNADANAIREDFLQGFYGRAGKPIGDFLKYLDARVLKEGIHGMEYQGIGAFNVMPWTSLKYRQENLPNWAWGRCENDLLTDEVMRVAHEYFAEAERVADNAEILARVRNSELGIDFVDVMRKVDKAIASSAADEKLAAYKDVEDLVRRFKENKINVLIRGDIEDEFKSIKKQLGIAD
jgi:hypothetical protein